MKTDQSPIHNARHPAVAATITAFVAAFTLLTTTARAPAQTGWGNALSFDGTNDWVQADDVPLANASFTIEAWARRLSTNTIDFIVGQGSIGTEKGLHFGFHQIVQNKFVLGFYNDDLFTTESYTDSDWHHWAGTYDATTKQRCIYRDGVLVASDVALTNYQGTGPFLIATPPWGTSGGAFHGLIDDVRVWSVARTASQIAENLHSPLTGAESNLVAYWRFDEGPGSVAFDSTPNGNVGTLWNGPQRTPSTIPPIWNHALSFDGIDDHVTMPAGIWFSNAFTIEAWVFVRSYNNWSRLLDFGNGTTGDNVILALSDETTGHPSLRRWLGGGRLALTSPDPLPTNRWLHLAATLSNNLAALYVNGIVVASADDWTPPSAVVRTNNYIARSPWVGNEYANFMLDELQIWNLARSLAEIQTDMSYPLGGSEAGLLACYRFDEGAGTTAYDATSSHLDGTLVNDPTWVVDSVVKIWDGSSNDFWSVGANWVGGVAPVDGDEVVFPSGAANFSNTNDLANLLLRSITFTTNSYTLRGNAFTLTNGIVGANLAGTNIIENNITFSTADQVIDVTSSLTLSGALSGGVGVIKNGIGTVTFSGATGNTYSGTTYAQAGTLALKKSGVDSALPGPLSINNSTVRLLSASQISNTSDVTIGASGTLDLNGFGDYINGLSGNGNVTLGVVNNYLVIGDNDASSIFDGIISGAGRLYKFGTGTITLNGANTLTGTTFVFNGTLQINGSQPQSPAYVDRLGTLGGSGTVGNIAALGQIAPGASLGTLTSSNVAFITSGTGGSFSVELTGPVPGTDYDQLNVRGTNNLANAALNVLVNFTKPVSIGQQFVIINNDGADPTTGTFAGLTNGATFVLKDFPFRINYNGGDANDVVLTLLDVPGGTSGYAVSSGNGDSVIDVNECDALKITITNKTGTSLTGISATLSSANGNVIVTQPFSSYADVPPAGKSTNAAPFQIAILPTAGCGTNFNSNLNVTTSSHGAFTVPVALKIGASATNPVRFDNNITTNVPDIGTIESTNTVVAWSGGPLTKIAVSLWLGAPYDADLNLTLIAPNGAAVDLSSGNGIGANFGTGSADTNRTIFDDAAATAITAGAPPFVGSFRPEGNFASLLGASPVGNWRLRIEDTGFWGFSDTLRAWSLFLYGTDCSPGGGACAMCAGGTGLTNTLDTTSSIMTSRLFRDANPSTCAAAKTCPGSVGGSFYYHAYPFYNASSNSCITVTLTAFGGNLFSVAYTGTFAPGNVCLNYLADCGSSVVGAGTTSCSFNVPANSLFTVVVNSIDSAGMYSLAVSGGDCPPIMDIQPLVGTNVNVSWPIVAGNYQLESSLSLPPNSWVDVPTQPTAVSNRFNVTDSLLGSTNQFYRLHRP